jgi:TetR/AcrR family transcriptional regulator
VPDPTDSRLALLDAAEALFARQGFAATSIKAIGAEAGVNPALLYYYYPDKNRLYHAVLERRLGSFARRMAAELPPDLPPLAAVERILRGYAGVMHAAPQLPRLLARELADHEAEHALPLIREIAAGLFQRICDLIRAGQRSGQIRADLEPRFTAISLVAQMAWFFVAQPAVSRMLGHEGTVPDRDVARYTDHAVAFSLAALAPAGGRSPAAGPRKRVRP